MHTLFARIIGVMLWLEKRLKSLTKHPFGRTALVLFFVALTFFSGGVVHAEDAATGKSGADISETILMYLAGFALNVAVVLSKLVITILQILIPVMTYNNFSNNPVVDSGWAILRDTVNMFFVVILIAIAFGTIFGAKRFQWQQQMTRLMIFAIVINFSRTLCGLMIDIGQVIMLTFANAIREIAAGNFVQMLGMGDIYSLSNQNSTFQNAATNAGAPAAKAFDFFASSIAAVFMMFAVLCIMIMLLIVLLYRIVMLWILISVAPLAWFVGGAGDLIQSNAYKDWWGQFKCLVVIGPILTFFLWLTLVVAGSGNIADSAGFATGGGAATDTAGGFLTSIFELPRLISFLVSLALLWSGFQAAQNACTSLPGIGNPAAFVKGGATKLAKGTVALGAKGAAGGLRIGGRAITKGGGMVARETGLTDKWSQAKEKMYRETAKRAGTGKIGQVIARKSTARAEQLAAERAATMTAGFEKFKGESGDSKNETLRRMAESPAFTTSGKRDEMALMMDAMGDEKRMKELRANGSWDALWKRHGKDIETNAKGDKNLKAKVDAFKKANADMTGAWGDVKSQDDAAKLSAFALADAKSKDQLQKVDSKFKRSKAELAAARKNDPNASEFMTVDEAIRSGKMFGKDDDRTKAYLEGRGAIYEGMKPEELGRLSSDVLAANVTPGLLDKKMGDANGPTVTEHLLTTRDAKAQRQLHERLNAPGADPKMRDGLLKGMGVENGKVADSAKFLASLQSNPAALSYLDDQQFADVTANEQLMIDLGNAFSDTKVLNTAVSGMKKDPKSGVTDALKSRVGSILEKNPTPEMIKAQGAFNAHVKVMEEGTKTQQIAAAVKAAPGQVRERINQSIDTSFINASVGSADQVKNLENQEVQLNATIDRAEPGSDELTKATRQLASVQTQLETARTNQQAQIEAIAGSDEMSKKLDDELAAQMGALANAEGVIAKDTAERRVVRQNLNDRDALKAKVDKINELKARVAAVKAKKQKL